MQDSGGYGLLKFIQNPMHFNLSYYIISCYSAISSNRLIFIEGGQHNHRCFRSEEQLITKARRACKNAFLRQAHLMFLIRELMFEAIYILEYSKLLAIYMVDKNSKNFLSIAKIVEDASSTICTIIQVFTCFCFI